jgi:hypothetical protein
MKNLTILLSFNTLLMLLLGCSQFLISHTPIQYSGEEGEKEFYNDYPELRGKVSELQTRIDQERLRETVKHYKFQIEEKALFAFIDRKGYQKFDGKVQNRSGDWVICDHSFMYLQDRNNIDPETRQYQYPSWWNISSVQQYTCFMEYDDRSHARYRALYDRKTETLYLYRHRAG